jgi:hypothetical protein
VKRLWIPLVLVLLHTALVILAGVNIALSHDPEMCMIWRLFWDIDYPIARCLDFIPPIFSSNALIPWTILVLGTIQWGIVGFAIRGIRLPRKFD